MAVNGLSKNSSAAFESLFENARIFENINVSVEHRNTRRVGYDEKAHRLTDEKYILNISGDNEKATINIECSGEKSELYALIDAANRISNGSISDGEYVCCPSFKVRGYIEGFYGKPWTFEERRSVLTLMAKNRMNTVYYAPKDDDYHRELWRELYPAKELSLLSALIGLAKKYYMNFYYCIAPGLSMKYSDAAEFEALCAKTKQLYTAGVRCFGLLLDDIDEELEYDEDKAVFSEMVNAHIDLVSRYYAFLKELDCRNRLTVCPMLYNGKGDEYYISKFGQNIGADISVFWTGRDVCSRDLTSFEALKFIEGTHHKPLYWDNYPVNDGTMHNEMHLSPIINRDSDLWKYSEGIISNCMEYAECSKIPLITFADYLWDSENYNPDLSFENAISQVVGLENAEAFLTFADHLYTSCLKDDNSKRMGKLFGSVEKAFNSGDIGDALMLAGGYIEKMNECNEYLKQDLPICRELSKWAKKFEVACEIINTLLLLVSENDDELKEEILVLIDKYDAMPAKLTDINLKEELGSLMNMNLTGC